MKHFEINFVDGSVETIQADEIPEDVFYRRETWTVTLMHLDAETQTTWMSYGTIHINPTTILFIKET